MTQDLGYPCTIPSMRSRFWSALSLGNILKSTLRDLAEQKSSLVGVAVQETCNSPKRTFICYILVGISSTKQPRTIFGTFHPRNSPSNIPKSTLRNLAELKSIWFSKNSFQKDLHKISQSQAYAILNPKAPGAHGKPAPNCESRRIKANA